MPSAIAHEGGGKEVRLRLLILKDEDLWLSQKMMGRLYDVKTHTLNYHLKKIFEDKELSEDSVIQIFRLTAADSKAYQTAHYNLSTQETESNLLRPFNPPRDRPGT